MKFGVKFYGSYPDLLVEKAVRAEQLGYESLWRGDHLIMPVSLKDEYPYGKYTSSAAQRFPVGARYLDVLLVFAAVSQVTTAIRFATSVYILPLRDPLAIAKDVATLDVLTKGRVIFGVGIGWMRAEYELAGKDPTRRGELLDEGLDLIEEAWSSESPSFVGAHYALPPSRFEPKPVQTPRPPILFGGESRVALERAARRGDGWIGHHQSPDEVREIIRHLGDLRRAYGRSSSPFEVTVRVQSDVSLERVKGLQSAGVDRVVLEAGTLRDMDDRSHFEAMERFGENVVQRFVSG